MKYCGVLEFSYVFVHIYILDCGGELEGATDRAREVFMLGHGC